MNFDKIQKSPCNKNCNETENARDSAVSKLHEDAEKKINLTDFLDFLKVTCHVNDMIVHTNGNQKGKPSLSFTASSATNKQHTDEINFKKLAQNRLVNDLIGHTMQLHDKNTALQPTEETGETANNTATQTDADRDNLSQQKSSPICSTVMSLAQNAPKKCDSLHKTMGLHPELSEKLDYVINEGVLDSVLPFICPVPIPTTFSHRTRAKQKEQPPQKPTPPTVVPFTESVLSDSEPNVTSPPELSKGCKPKEPQPMQTPVRRKSLFPARVRAQTMAKEKHEPEVVIHVCDEVKNISRDFSCPQSLLISKMGYFADVTAGQKLDDMDISVHCDIQIFEWLMRWVKFSAAAEQSSASGAAGALDGGPQLDASNVVPILVSASFLQMEPLLLDCLTFCHSRLNDVVRTSTNLVCLNDSIVTRLAAMFTNIELEIVRDKKERVTPRLWTKLIQSLCEPEPEALRGHYYSLSGIFRCTKCGACLTNTIKGYINCVQNNMRLNRWGQLVSYHVRDSMWDINLYIAQLFKELRSWRRVYWKLWGHCHFLYCCLCETHFPVYQMTWCRYHTDSPNYLGPVTEGCAPGPAGRNPCCGQQTFRFETLPGPNGCRFREHSVLVETDRERAILSISQLVAEGNALWEDPPQHLQDLIAQGDCEPRWMGLPLLPQRSRQGLLPILNPDDARSKISRRPRQGVAAYYGDSSSESDSSATLEEYRLHGGHISSSATCCDLSVSSDGCESECSPPKPPKPVQTKKARKKGRQVETPGRFWSGELSARSNQDYQREFEEKVMKQVVAMVNKKTGSDHSLLQNAMPAGGSYVRLESEWRDQMKQRNLQSIGTTHSTSSNNCHMGLLARHSRNNK